MEVMTMHEQEKLYEQYEDAVFALLMDKVAEENGKKLLQQNEELLADPDAAVPETLSKRCLRTIEKAYRKSQWKAAAKKVTRVLNRVALWILVPLFLFGTAFACGNSRQASRPSPCIRRTSSSDASRYPAESCPWAKRDRTRRSNWG